MKYIIVENTLRSNNHEYPWIAYGGIAKKEKKKQTLGIIIDYVLKLILINFGPCVTHYIG